METNKAIDILEEVSELDDSMYAYNPAYAEALNTALIALKAQRTGKWIKKPVKHFCSRDDWNSPAGSENTWSEEEGSWFEDEYFCSECDFQPPYPDEEPSYNYCPECGCKMLKQGK